MKTAVIALVAIVAAGSLFARDLNINGERSQENSKAEIREGGRRSVGSRAMESSGMSGHSRSFRQDRHAKMPFR